MSFLSFLNSNIQDDTSNIIFRSLWWNKTGILSSCSYVSIIVWLQHEDFNEVLNRRKNRWKLLNEAAYCFEQILEPELYKVATVLPPTFHLINQQDILGIDGETYGLLHMDTRVSDD